MFILLYIYEDIFIILNLCYDLSQILQQTQTNVARFINNTQGRRQVLDFFFFFFFFGGGEGISVGVSLRGVSLFVSIGCFFPQKNCQAPLPTPMVQQLKRLYT